MIENIKIFEISERNNQLIQELLKIWEDSVRTTHLFLSDKEIENIKKYVPEALKGISNLIVAKNKNHKPVAFMGIQEHKLEMLFVSAEERGKKIGSMLIKYAIEKFSINEVSVNEQNPMAKGFYEHMGFHVYKRTKTEEQGNPYPLLYMRL